VPRVPVLGTWVLGLSRDSPRVLHPLCFNARDAHGSKTNLRSWAFALPPFSCYKRLPFLKIARSRDVFLEELGRLRAELGFRIIGYVVMPEHVHLLINEPPGATPSTILHRLKLRVAKRMRKRRRRVLAGQIPLPFEECKGVPRPFWQPRFHDFNVYSTGKRMEKLNYMHGNPVKRGLVNHPKDWPWSSWSFYENGGSGLIRMDVVKPRFSESQNPHP
jgi:putative transposase